MKVRYEKKEGQSGRKMVKDIPVGTVFSGKIGAEGVYAKTYVGIVDLWNMRYTWDLPEDEPVGRGSVYGVEYIYNYKELDVELLVKGEK